MSPYDCPEPALYVIVSEFKKPFMEVHPGGARVMSSSIPVKPSPFAQMKTVNYLFNVLMKKESVDEGVDFVVSFDENGHLAEGPTENAGIVTPDRILKVPRLERILAGTTMLRTLELAQALVKEGVLARTENTDIPPSEVSGAAEMLIFGTTPDVSAAVEFDGKPIGNGKPGPVFARLSRMLRDDMNNNPAMQTPI